MSLRSTTENTARASERSARRRATIREVTLGFAPARRGEGGRACSLAERTGRVSRVIMGSLFTVPVERAAPTCAPCSPAVNSSSSATWTRTAQELTIANARGIEQRMTSRIHAVLLASLAIACAETRRPDGALLPVGSPAPDVVGEDAAGKPVALSGQKGKLAVI